VGVEVDWSHRADYMHQRHGVPVEQVTEALADSRAIVADPDPTSRSGTSARVIGYSESAGAVLVVILVHRDDRPGCWWGANGWRANSTDQRTYTEQNAETETGDE
jgi:uncharacterized DUF497 family protein